MNSFDIGCDWRGLNGFSAIYSDSCSNTILLDEPSDIDRQAKVQTSILFTLEDSPKFNGNLKHSF